jgi:hypothetical protein
MKTNNCSYANEDEKKKTKKKKQTKAEEEEEAVKTAMHGLVLRQFRFKKVRRRLYEEVPVTGGSDSREKCSPIRSTATSENDDDSVFGDGKDDEILLKASASYEQGLDEVDDGGLKTGTYAAKIVEAMVMITKEEEEGGDWPISKDLPQEG